MEYIPGRSHDEVALSSFGNHISILDESWRDCKNYVINTFKNHIETEIIFEKEVDLDGFAFLTRSKNWSEFSEKVFKHAGSKLARAGDEIFATGAVWQNKLAKSFVNTFLSEQRIGND